MPTQHRTGIHLLHTVFIHLFNYLLPWLVLPLLLLYTYLELAQAPYIGFTFSPSRGTVQEVLVHEPEHELLAGDVILAVGGVAWNAEYAGFHNTLLSYLRPGDLLHLEIERNSERRSVTWRVPGFNGAEFINRLLNVWVLGYFFWLAGMATTLLVRPRDERTRLFTAFFILTAIWLVVGNTGRWNLWNSTVLFRAAIWLCVPVYLQLHWLIPKELAPLPAWMWPLLYGVAAVTAVAQWFELLPRNLYGVALLVALAGSVALLILHYWRQPAQRSQIRFLTFVLLFALIPMSGLGIVSALGSIPSTALLAFGLLPLLPGVYFYTIYRYQMGGLSFRANQLLSLYLFLLSLGSGLTVAFALISLLPEGVSAELLAEITLSLLAAWSGIYAFPPFQRFIESRLLGIRLSSAQLFETYAARITTSLTVNDLAHLLEHVIFPSLMIRQSALLLVREERLVPIIVSGVDTALLPTKVGMAQEIMTMEVMAKGFYLPARREPASTRSDDWVCAGVPLRFEERMVGVWLFGRRDPDDIYSASELAILQTLAHQTAIALVNIEQAQQLRALYDANIERHEIERTHLAHELHDDILGGLSLLKASIENGGPTESFEKAYQGVKQRIIHMITGLRPAMLNYGLYAALDELTDDLNERAYADLERLNQLAQTPESDRSAKPASDISGDASGETTAWLTYVRLEVEPSLAILPPKVEEYLFRIVQQACENALQHSHARTIRILGSIATEGVDLTVLDDGVGFALAGDLAVADLLAHQHFGLVGMMERARSVGAELSIKSEPGHGVSIHVIWKPNQLLKNLE